MENFLEMYDRAIDCFGQRVHQARPSQWSDITPAPPWTVRDVVNHLVWAQSYVRPLITGETVTEIGDRFVGDLLGDDPAAAWDRVAKEALDAASAADATQQLQLIYGVLSVQEYIELQVSELTVHSWDLARGLNVDSRLDPHLVDATLARFHTDRLYGGAAPATNWPSLFAAPIDPGPGADPQSRLLSLAGRIPAAA